MQLVRTACIVPVYYPVDINHSVFPSVFIVGPIHIYSRTKTGATPNIAIADMPGIQLQYCKTRKCDKCFSLAVKLDMVVAEHNFIYLVYFA